MEDYKKFYYELFNSITDLIMELKQHYSSQETIIKKLRQLQVDAEERFLADDE